MFREVASADRSDAYAIYYTGQCLFDDKDYESALTRFRAASSIDPYLRSCYYGAFQAYQRLGDMKKAKEQLAVFQKLANNPQARNAEIKYSRMGPKAETMAVRMPGSVAESPQGELFESPVKVVDAAWTNGPDCSITCCDLNGDGMTDLFASGTKSAVLLSVEEGFKMAADHPLHGLSDVQTALWGDIDNDGLVDVYLCRKGLNQLWRQTESNKWSDITESSKTAGVDANTIDGALFDADHDGDLDIFAVNADGPNELFNNNLDGTFRALASDQGLQGDDASRGIVVSDFDNDRDADILVFNQGNVHQVYVNDRLWNYEMWETYHPFRDATVWATVAADLDANGSPELIVAGPDGLQAWTHTFDDKYDSRDVLDKVGEGTLAAQDINGDGRLEIITATEDGWAVVDTDGKPLFQAQAAIGGEFTLLTTSNGYAIVAYDQEEKAPVIWKPGPGRSSFALVAFSGKENKADQMRSNASGVGIRAAARVGSQWTSLQTFRDRSGPGQSLQPVPVGLAGAAAVDYVHLLWPDGLFQTELGLTPDKVHRIEETQRQVSSCPVLFVWDGNEYQFVTDILGVGGQGFNHGRGEYGPPRPWERLMLPEGLLAARDGHFSMKIGEPMEESCYLDHVKLVYYDLPRGWKMTVDDRQATGAPAATGNPVFYRVSMEPSHAENDRGEDVLALVAEADRRPVMPGKSDRRFLGHTAKHSLTLQFEKPLEEIQNRPVLVMDGWVEYPYSQTTFASWQAGAPYEAPTLEARGSDGQWQVVYEKFGYPAGMPRQMALPLDPEKLPQGTTALRLSSSMEIYWDRIFVAIEVPCPEAKKGICELKSAVAQEVGFPKRTNTADRQPSYDYGNRVPLWDTRHQPGYYTNFGPVLPLLESVDDAIVIFGPGEEVEVEFVAPKDAPSAGVTRYFVLESAGWCKDMDLYTKDGESIEPLPLRAESVGKDNPQRDALHRKFNQRFRAG
jgi:hypothetical protein